jgi:hypothetical protein
MNRILRGTLCSLAFALPAIAAEGDFASFGNYIVRQQTKITGSGKVIQVPILSLIHI